MITNIEYHFPPSKKQILERLFTEGHITFEEMWILLDDTPEIRYIPLTPQPDIPDTPQWPPHYTTSDILKP